MIYTTCIMWYATFSYRKSRMYSIILAVALAGLALFFTGYYHYLKDPTFHQNAYAILTTAVLVRAMYLMEVNLRSSLRSSIGASCNGSAVDEMPTNGSIVEKSSQKELRQVNGRAAAPSPRNHSKRANNRDERILQDMWFMVLYGLILFLGGFTIWSLDIKYCSTLRSWRQEIGLPWGMLLEGHGWW